MIQTKFKEIPETLQNTLQNIILFKHFRKTPQKKNSVNTQNTTKPNRTAREV